MNAIAEKIPKPIEITDVVKTFGGKQPWSHGATVLDHIDMQVESGEIRCLLGPSGGGKTTLVNLIVGITVPNEGTVRIMGEKAPFPTVRKRIGFMPQEDALYDDIGAEDNLRFFGTLYGLKGTRLAHRIDVVLGLARLTGDRKKLVRHFSGGMKRRLSLGVALLHDPDLLVLDEPTVGLDPEHRHRIWDEFRALRDAGKTLLVTTHIMDEAQRCDHIAMMREGRIIAVDSPDNLLKRTQTTALEDAFLILEGAEVRHA